MLNKSIIIIEEMNAVRSPSSSYFRVLIVVQTLSEVEDAFNEFVESHSKKHLSVGRNKHEKEKHRESGSVFGIFKKGNFESLFSKLG